MLAVGYIQLAIGNARGNLLIYNRATGKKIPILGKYNAAITTGCWNSDGKLALGSQDKTVRISAVTLIHFLHSFAGWGLTQLVFPNAISDNCEQRGRRHAAAGLHQSRPKPYACAFTQKQGKKKRARSVESDM
jgi:hypothetical protein